MLNSKVNHGRLYGLVGFEVKFKIALDPLWSFKVLLIRKVSGLKSRRAVFFKGKIDDLYLLVSILSAG